MMKKLLFLSILILLGTQVFAQKYMTRSGHIWFFSHTPLEDIEAHNYQANSALDVISGDMVFSILIKGFEFQKALMQEHFNEKYMESDKYPKASFTGKVTNISSVNTKKNGVYPVTVKGKMTIHGVTKDVETKGTLEVKDGKILGKAKFPITVKDYNITIPAVVKDNIAEVIDVTVDVAYEEVKK